MAIHLFDTSALAKRYLSEAGSRWVRQVVAGETIAISRIVIVEMASVAARHYGEGRITRAQRNAIVQSFQSGIQDMVVIDVAPDVLDDAAALLISLPSTTMLRTLDAIHVISATRAFRAGAALGNLPGTLVSADNRLLNVAQQAGLATDDPRLHP